MAPIEKLAASGPLIAGTGNPVGEPPVLVTTKVRVDLPNAGGMPKSWLVGEIVMLAGCTAFRLQRRFLR